MVTATWGGGTPIRCSFCRLWIVTTNERRDNRRSNRACVATRASNLPGIFVPELRQFAIAPDLLAQESSI